MTIEIVSMHVLDLFEIKWIPYIQMLAHQQVWEYFHLEQKSERWWKINKKYNIAK